jgi:hypothetical protein
MYSIFFIIHIHSIQIVGTDGSGKRTIFKLLKEKSQKAKISLEMYVYFPLNSYSKYDISATLPMLFHYQKMSPALEWILLSFWLVSLLMVNVEGGGNSLTFRDMTNKVSFESTKMILERHLHPDYLLGRSCLIATKGLLPSSRKIIKFE